MKTFTEEKIKGQFLAERSYPNVVNCWTKFTTICR